MVLLINCFKVFMNFIYIFFKLLKVQNKVTFISRQSNNISLDFKLLVEEIQKESPDVKVVVLTKKLEDGLLNKIKYFFHMFVQMYHIATSKVVVLDSYCILISILKHKKSLKVIQIWHALGSLKKFGYSTLGKKDGRNEKIAKAMKMHHNYTYILTSSKASSEFFRQAFGAKPEQMKIMNLPRVDFLQSNEAQKQVKQKFQEKYPETKNGKKNILYCPTKHKSGNIPYKEMSKQILYNKYNFIVKLHNGIEVIYVNGKEIKKQSLFTGMELLHVADYIITDYSAICYEASITQKPIYFYAYDYDTYKEERGTYIDYQKEMPGPICKDFSEILNLIETNNFNLKKEIAFCQKYIENLDKNATKELVELILESEK